MKLADVYSANRWLPLREEIEFEMRTPQPPHVIKMRVATAEAVINGMQFEENPIFNGMQKKFWTERFIDMPHVRLAKLCKALELPRPGANPHSIPKGELIHELVHYFRKQVRRHAGS